MKIALALLLAAVCVAAERQISVDAPPARDIYRKTPPSPAGRGKRSATCGTPTKLNAAQADESVKSHNQCRSREPSSNMKKLVWSDEMASLAQAWANACKWEHGMLNDCAGNRIGQNLFVEASAGGYPTLNLTHSIEAWYGEIKDWTWKTETTGSCTPGKICGHYTAMVNALSGKVGCAYALCPTMTVGGQVWTNALYVVCDYTPPGNVVGESIYLKGPACSNCDSAGTGKGYKCENNLCAECTPATDASCKCGTPLACANGGSWSASTCSCQCAKGFYGLKCEQSCACSDTSADCSYYAPYCGNEDYRDFMTENCKGTCNYCDVPASCNA